MLKPTDEEIAMFHRLRVQEPLLVKFCQRQRAACRDGLEQGAPELVRGQSVTYKELLTYLKPTR